MKFQVSFKINVMFRHSTYLQALQFKYFTSEITFQNGSEINFYNGCFKIRI